MDWYFWYCKKVISANYLLKLHNIFNTFDQNKKNCLWIRLRIYNRNQKCPTEWIYFYFICESNYSSIIRFRLKYISQNFQKHRQLLKHFRWRQIPFTFMKHSRDVSLWKICKIKMLYDILWKKLLINYYLIQFNTWKISKKKISQLKQLQVYSTHVNTIIHHIFNRTHTFKNDNCIKCQDHVPNVNIISCQRSFPSDSITKQLTGITPSETIIWFLCDRILRGHWLFKFSNFPYTHVSYNITFQKKNRSKIYTYRSILHLHINNSNYVLSKGICCKPRIEHTQILYYEYGTHMQFGFYIFELWFYIKSLYFCTKY